MRRTNFLSLITASIVFFSLTLTPIFAQDAAQFLRLSVTFNTFKNSGKLSDEKKKEIADIEAKARAASSAQKFGDAIRYLNQGITLMRGQTWTPSRALGIALQMQSDRVIADPGDNLIIKITQQFALEEPLSGKLNGSLTIAPARNKDSAKKLKSLTEINHDFIASPLNLEAKLPELEDGEYVVTLSLSPAEGDAITKSSMLSIVRGLSAQQNSLRARAAKAATEFSSKPEFLNALAAVNYHLSIPDLVSAGQISGARDFKKEIAVASTYLDQITKGENPLRAMKGDFRWAYQSAVDNSLQPYRVFVPAKYDALKPTPMVVALHGMGGDENSYFVSYDNGVIKREAEARGYIVVCPKGRGTASMYMGDAEKDVMDVIAAMRRDYNIDANRIYLTGHSMGGYGTWSIAPKYPDLFAAIAPISGGGNPSALSKIKHVPEIVIHGDNDPTVSVENSRKMVKAAQELGIKIKYVEVPGGNHTDIAVPAMKGIFDFFDENKRESKVEVNAAGTGSQK